MTTTNSVAPRAGFLRRLRYKLVPDHLIGEVLAKDWIDTAIPGLLLILVLSTFAVLTPDFYGAYNLSNTGRVLGEYLLMAIGQAIVVIAGGIDLSVGSIFAICNFLALALVFKFKVHVLVALPLTILLGGAIGAVNGVLIGYLRLRAFLTTLVMLIILRAVVDVVALKYGSNLISDYDVVGIDIFDWLADGNLFGVPSSFLLAIVIGVAAHMMLSRMRLGWHMLAVGGSRRSAFNAGIHVRRTVFLTYVFSGALAGFAAFLYAARLTAAGSTTGIGIELIIITGVVLGGISLGGGRGNIIKAVLGTTIVVCIQLGMLRLGLATGGSSMVLGTILLLAVIFDIRWNKNRMKILNRAYVSPTLVEQPPRPSIAAGSASPYARVDRFFDVRPIGLGVLDGPEDMCLDDAGNLFAGTRKGDIYRFLGPDFSTHELYVHTGGRPLGMQVDRDGSLVVCIAGMGLYRITKAREVIALSIQTNRSFSIVDDSRVRMADDLDIAPDGKIYFTDPTIRYEASDWLTDALEGRGNGRLLCYDPADGSTRTVAKNLVFANGVCLAHDRQSIFVAETWASRVMRYWIAGPNKGSIEPFIPNLPGYPDNINRASDGTYWLALVGIRTPAFDLALRKPAFRKRMAERVAPDEWLFPNMNYGCVVKFDETGRIVDCLWDRHGVNHPMITSMREDRGWLYLGGVSNNRIGRYRIPGADPEWTAAASYRGEKP